MAVKSSEELAYELLAHRDACEAAKKRRHRIARNIAACAGSLLCVLVIGFVAAHGYKEANIPVIDASDVYAEANYAAPLDQSAGDERVPANGEARLSAALKNGLEAYKDQNVRFAVTAKLYRDGVSCKADGAVDVGGIVFRDSSSVEMNMTAKEIHSYSPGNDYEVALCLVGE